MTAPVTARVRFDEGTVCVHVDRDYFGAQELIARLSAKHLHPFRDRANHDWLFELVDFVAAYYALDRFTARPHHGWCRRFTIEYPVRPNRIEQWRAHARLITEWLLALTGDEVVVVPLPWEGNGDRYQHPVLQLDQQVDAVGLVSDGLDSLCGLDSVAQSGRSIAWASVFSGHRGKRIRTAVKAFGPAYARRHFHMRMDLVNGNDDKEQTQRSRTVLAVVMGMTLAYALESSSVECYENGIGLLNLSIPDLQYGAMSSQVLNPSSLPLWDRISRAFFDQPVELRFPNRFRTKSEMLSTLSQGALALVAGTFSCDAEERAKGKGVLHCGTCGSCRLRQLAVTCGARSQYDAAYANVRRDPYVNTQRLMHYHADLLRDAMRSENPWQALCRLQPELRNIPYSESRRRVAMLGGANALEDMMRRETIALLSRHVDEVDRWAMVSSVA